MLVRRSTECSTEQHPDARAVGAAHGPTGPVEAVGRRDNVEPTNEHTQARRTNVDRDGDDLVLSIKRPSWKYVLVVVPDTPGSGPNSKREGEDDNDGNGDDDANSDVNLERFGVDI